MPTERKPTIKYLLPWIPVALIAAAIFCFSQQPADQSTELSDKVTLILLAAAERLNIFHASPDSLYEICSLLSTPVRKSAHIIEFAALHIALLNALFRSGFRGKRWLKTALFLTVLYACTDEFHQIFIPGRAGMITDVMIDNIGSGLITAVLWHRESRRADG